MMAQVNVFGTLHVDRPNKVKSELSEVASGADIIFTETPRDESGPTENRVLFRRNPALWVMGYILDGIWGLIGFALTRSFLPVDAVATREVARQKGIDTQGVDINLVRLASDIGPLFSVASWVWSSLVGVLLIYGLVTINPFLFTAGIAAGFLPIAPFAFGTLQKRDKKIAANIENVFEECDDLDTACLVVGRKHMSGVIEELETTEIKVQCRHRSKFFRQVS